ncbi:MAG: hypothetical protein E6X17_15820 [Sporomusaceae bacterium]|nr:hypothetical protein [Sporomusaceae bacterium]
MSVRKNRRLRNSAGGDQSNTNSGLTAGRPAERGAGVAAEADIAGMLSQISVQLSQLQGQRLADKQQPADSGGQPTADNGQSGQTSGTNCDQLAELQRLLGQLLPPGRQQEQTASSGLSQSGLTQQQPAKTAQTAAQALSDAQYELASELDSSLQKLKQVISESEKLAEKISRLLGEDSSGS